MRAATTSGYVFVGSAQHSQPSPEEKYHVKVMRPDRAAAEERQAYRDAIAKRVAWWQEQIADVLAEFGPEIAERLREGGM